MALGPAKLGERKFVLKKTPARGSPTLLEVLRKKSCVDLKGELLTKKKATHTKREYRERDM